MKFIFPQNYNFKNKLFGIFDYSTLILNIILGLLIYGLLNIFIHDISIKIFTFIILFFPFFLFSIIGFNHENIVYILIYLIKFLIKPKLYLYNKNNL